MVKCPFCGFNNEEGALFCEQCKSDLGSTTPTPAPAPAPPGEPVPVASVVEAVPETAPPMAEVVEAPPAAAPGAAETAPAPAEAPAAKLPADAKPVLVVLRGQKVNAEYPIYEGLNFIGRADEKPVDIDLEDQEPPDRIWCSRQHALITFENNELTVEDLNSANGTYVNRTRIYPGQKKPLNVGDVIQIGNVQMKLKV